MHNHFLFFDETVDHGLTYVDPNFPLFLLCGCLFKESELTSFEEKMNAIRQKYWQSEKLDSGRRAIKSC